MTKRPFKEAEMIRTVKVKGSDLDVVTQIILLENVQIHQETRTKEHLLEVLGAIAVKKMMKSDENSSIDDLALDNEYNKLCKMSLKIITKNKRLKATRNRLENELSELKLKLAKFEKNKEVDLECTSCQLLKVENEKLKEEATKLTKFEKSIHCLNEMLSNQKPFDLVFNSFEASSNGTKEEKFMKAQEEVSPDGGPIKMGSLYSVQAAPKAIMGPPSVGTPESEKGNLSKEKSIWEGFLNAF
ncbi:hypothetical protein Tco_1410975 [Tanacetum coccineum]